MAASPAAAPRPLVLIHGYSADYKAFDVLRTQLANHPAMNARGVSIACIDVCSYVSLNNEINIKDIAEGLDRAFRFDPTLNAKYDMRTCDFDAIVHSTGMLVLRSWLTNYGSPVRGANTRLKRLKHLIGVAPATWGSPQASKGRTWLGAMVKGDHQPGPDFLNAGDMVLDGLELGGKFTWDLAHIDLLGKDPYYGKGPDTPFVTVFIGNSQYTGLSSVANDPGTDGTVRWAGCGLNTRKITIDLTRFPTDETGNPALRRLRMSPWADDRLHVPIIAVDGRNHATILSNPDPGMVDLIADFLRVGETDTTLPATAVTNGVNPVAVNAAATGQPAVPSFDDWLVRAQAYGAKGMVKMLANPGAGAGQLSQEVHSFFAHLFGMSVGPVMEGWQQFVVHAVDERGDGVSDYLLEVLRADEKGDFQPFQEMYTDVHAYRADPSFRCFHIRLPQGMSSPDTRLQIRVHASSGTALIGYQGYKDLLPDTQAVASTEATGQQMNAKAEPVILDVGAMGTGKASLFHPFTTTLIELILSREPVPLQAVSQVLAFVWDPATAQPVAAPAPLASVQK